jgi:hypothetical protein
MQQDFAQPMTLFKDVKSGQTWSQAGTLLKRIYDSGVTPAQVQANPNLIPLIPFYENIFPGAKNYKFNGSASANYYYTVYGTYAGSDLDGLNDMDRLRLADDNVVAAHTLSGTEHRAELKLRGVGANGFHPPGEVSADSLVFWFAQSFPQADKERCASHTMPVHRVCGRRMNPHQYVTVLGSRFLHLFELKNIR